MARRQTIAEGGAAEEPGTIRAIIINPKKRTVRAVDLPAVSGDPARGFGTQLAPDALVAVLGTKAIEQLDLRDGEVALVAARHAGPKADEAWRYDVVEPIRGVGVVVAYDAGKDAYADTRLSVEAVHRAIAFGDCGEAEEDGRERHAETA